MNVIYINGDILTMKEGQDSAEAVVEENGKIVFVGDKQKAFTYQRKDSKVIDLQGTCLLPGFIDGHSHFVSVANSLRLCDLSNAKSFADIVKLMKKFQEKHGLKENEWLIGTGYDHNFLKEKKHPDRYVLDEISQDTPIYITHISSHMGVANSKALKLLDIKKDMIDPQGGRYGRDAKGKLSGYMEENAFLTFQKRVPMPDISQLFDLMKQAQDIYASYGITTIQDGMVTRELFALLKAAADQGIFHQDIIGYLDLAKAGDLEESCRPYFKDYHHHFKLGGYKVFLDGSPQGKTAWMLTPYKGDHQCGYPALQDDQLYQYIETSVKQHHQIIAHCNGDAAAKQYVDQFEKVMEKYPKAKDIRAVMIHAQLVRKEELKRMKAIGMMPSFFVAHTWYWGDIHIENFGYERACQISTVKTAVEEGLPYTFHQDSPVVPCDIMKSIWCAVNRKTRTGISIGKEEAVSVWDALKANTIYGAYQYFEEACKGSIEEGKLADFVILDHNPLTVDTKDLADIKVLCTIKEGNIIYRAK